MNKYKNRYKIWVRIISTAVVCLFYVNTLSWAIPAGSIYPSTPTLQVQSLFNRMDPIVDVIAGEYDRTQLKLELILLFAKALEDEPEPWHDINSDFDTAYGAIRAEEKDRIKDRILDLTADPLKKDRSTIVDLEYRYGPQEGEKFTITLESCKSIYDIQPDGSNVKIKKDEPARTREVGIDDDLGWERVTRSLVGIFREILEDKLDEIAETISPTAKKFIIKNVSFEGSGWEKGVLRVEADTDFGPMAFGFRYIQPYDGEPPEVWWEKTKREMGLFNEFRELNGVAIDIKRAYNARDDFSEELSAELLESDIYAITIGEFVEGKSLEKLADITSEEKKKLYREAIKSMIRGWLLTLDASGKGYSITDLKGDNFVHNQSDPHLMEVVYVDFGNAQRMEMSTLIDNIRTIFIPELGVERGGQEEIDLLSVIPESLDEFLRRERGITKEKRGLIIKVGEETRTMIEKIAAAEEDASRMRDGEEDTDENEKYAHRKGAGGRIEVYERYDDSQDEKIVKVYDPETRILWEQYYYDEKGDPKMVILYNPVSGRRVKCEFKERRKWDPDDQSWRISQEAEDGSFLPVGFFSMKDIGGMERFEKTISFFRIQLIDVKLRDPGIGKTVKRWTALKAHREGKRLRSEKTTSPLMARINAGIYDMPDLYVSHRGWPEKGHIPYKIKNQRELRNIILQREYLFARPKISTTVTVGPGDTIKTSSELPPGWELRIDKGRLMGEDKKGEPLVLEYEDPIYLDGTVNAGKIAEAQLKESRLRERKKRANLIIIPTYNEADVIEELITEIFKVFPGTDILITDDNSPDGTGDLIDRLSESDDRIHCLHREKKEGIGPAYIAAFKWALERHYEYMTQMDADFSHQPKYLPDLFEKIKSNDLVLGSRYIKGGGVKDWGLKRRLISMGGSLYARFWLWMPYKDLTGGFKCWRRELLEKIGLNDISTRGYAFQVEATYRAHKKGARIQETPIIFPDRRKGQTKMSKEIFWEAVFTVPKLRWRSIRGTLFRQEEQEGQEEQEDFLKAKFLAITHNPELGIINDPAFIEKWSKKKEIPDDEIVYAVPVTRDGKTIIIFNREAIKKDFSTGYLRVKCAEMVLFHENVHRVILEMDEEERDEIDALFWKHAEYAKDVGDVVYPVQPSLKRGIDEFIAHRMTFREYYGEYPELLRAEDRIFAEKLERLVVDERGKELWEKIDGLEIHKKAKDLTGSQIRKIESGLNASSYRGSASFLIFPVLFVASVITLFFMSSHIDFSQILVSFPIYPLFAFELISRKTLIGKIRGYEKLKIYNGHLQITYPKKLCPEGSFSYLSKYLRKFMDLEDAYSVAFRIGEFRHAGGVRIKLDALRRLVNDPDLEITVTLERMPDSSSYWVCVDVEEDSLAEQLREVSRAEGARGFQAVVDKKKVREILNEKFGEGFDVDEETKKHPIKEDLDEEGLINILADDFAGIFDRYSEKTGIRLDRERLKKHLKTSLIDSDLLRLFLEGKRYYAKDITALKIGFFGLESGYTHLFENHRRDSYIGANIAALLALGDAEKIEVAIAVGLQHEFGHETAPEPASKKDLIQLEEHFILSNNTRTTFDLLGTPERIADYIDSLNRIAIFNRSLYLMSLSENAVRGKIREKKTKDEVLKFLVDPRFIDYYRAIRKTLNSKHKDATWLYPCSGADAITVFNAVNPQKAVLVDKMRFYGDKKELSYDKLTAYVLRKRGHFNKNWTWITTDDFIKEFGEIYSPLMWELEAMGAEDISRPEEIARSTYRITFTWKHPDEREKRKKEIIFFSEVDVLDIENYPQKLKDILTKGIDGFMEKAEGDPLFLFEEMPGVKDYLIRMLSSVKENGSVINDRWLTEEQYRELLERVFGKFSLVPIPMSVPVSDDTITAFGYRPAQMRRKIRYIEEKDIREIRKTLVDYFIERGIGQRITVKEIIDETGLQLEDREMRNALDDLIRMGFPLVVTLAGMIVLVRIPGAKKVALFEKLEIVASVVKNVEDFMQQNLRATKLEIEDKIMVEYNKAPGRERAPPEALAEIHLYFASLPSFKHPYALVLLDNPYYSPELTSALTELIDQLKENPGAIKDVEEMKSYLHELAHDHNMMKELPPEHRHLFDFVKYEDRFDAQHAGRVARLFRAVGKHPDVNLFDELLDIGELAGIAHDIAKKDLKIRGLTHKPRKLSEAEKKIIRSHSIRSSRKFILETVWKMYEFIELISRMDEKRGQYSVEDIRTAAILVHKAYDKEERKKGFDLYEELKPLEELEKRRKLEGDENPTPPLLKLVRNLIVMRLLIQYHHTPNSMKNNPDFKQLPEGLKKQAVHMIWILHILDRIDAITDPTRPYQVGKPKDVMVREIKEIEKDLPVEEKHIFDTIKELWDTRNREYRDVANEVEIVRRLNNSVVLPVSEDEHFFGSTEGYMRMVILKAHDLFHEGLFPIRAVAIMIVENFLTMPEEEFIVNLKLAIDILKEANIGEYEDVLQVLKKYENSNDNDHTGIGKAVRNALRESVYEKTLRNVWKRLHEMCDGDLLELKKLRFEDFAEHFKARPVKSEARRLKGFSELKRIFYFSPRAYHDFVNNFPGFLAWGDLEDAGIVSGGIYYFKEDLQDKKLGVPDKDMLRKVKNVHLFHEICERALDEQDLEDPEIYYSLSHSSLEILDEELRFAAVMGRKVFKYQLDLRIKDVNEIIKDDRDIPDRIKRRIQLYLNKLKREKKNLDSAWRTYAEEARARFYGHETSKKSSSRVGKDDDDDNGTPTFADGSGKYDDVVREIEKDIFLDKKARERLKAFYEQYIKLKERFIEDKDGIDNEYLSKCFTAERIADVFYLAEVYEFNIFDLLGEKRKTLWVKQTMDSKIEYEFRVEKNDIVWIYDISPDKDEPVPVGWAKMKELRVRIIDRRVHEGYGGLNLGNFLMKSGFLLLWAQEKEKEIEGVIDFRAIKLRTHYETTGARTYWVGAGDRRAHVGIGYHVAWDLFGGLDAGILTEEQAERIKGLDPGVWRVWSQRKLDRYFKLTEYMEKSLLVEANKAFSDEHRNDEIEKLRVMPPEDVARFIEGYVEQRALEKKREKKRRKKVNRRITATNTHSLDVMRTVETYLKKELTPVDIVVDLSLIPKEDIEANMETWAYLILSCIKLKNVNFIFEIPDPSEEGAFPEALAGDIEDTKKAKMEMIRALEKAIETKAVLFDKDDIDGLIKNRLNVKRDDAIKIPVISKAWLKWMDKNGIGLKPDQYPVALDEITAVKDRGVTLRNFEAALAIGLAKASLVIAKRRDDKKEEDKEKELPRLRKKLLTKLQRLYSVFREDVTLKEKTLDNMISPYSRVRLRLAISLALPPITRMAVKKLREFHDSIHLLLQAC